MKQKLDKKYSKIFRRIICLLLVASLAVFSVNRASADTEEEQKEETTSISEEQETSGIEDQTEGEETREPDSEAAEEDTDAADSEEDEDLYLDSQEEDKSSEDEELIEDEISSEDDISTDETSPEEDEILTDDVEEEDSAITLEESGEDVQLVVSGMEDAGAFPDVEFDFLEGVSVEAENAPEGTQYRIVVSGVETPEGGSYTWEEGETGFVPSEDDNGLVYVVNYVIQSSEDDGETWADLPEEEQSDELTREITVLSADDMIQLISDEDDDDSDDVKTIEVSLLWSNAEEGKEIDNGYSGTSTTYLTPQAQLSIHTGGQAVYEKGAIEVRIPLKLYTYRENWGQSGQTTAGAAYGTTIAQPVDYGCPKAPNMSSTSSFNYTIDDNGTPNDESDDVIVFTNYNKISGISNHVIQWSYSLNPKSTVDMTKAELTAQLTAVNTASKTGAVTEEKTSNTITYTVDTKPGTISVSKVGHYTTYSASDYYFYPTWNAWKNNNYMFVKPTSSTWSYASPVPTTQTVWGPLPSSRDEYEKYFWETWRVVINSTSGNQPGYITLTEDLPEGAFINHVYSATSASDTVYTVDKDTNVITRTKEATTDYVYITVAYPRELITADMTTYSNTVKASYAGVDNNEDISTAEATGKTSTVITWDQSGTKKTGTAIYTRPNAISEEDWDTSKYAYACWTVYVRPYGHIDGRNFQIKDVLTEDDTYDGGEVIGYNESTYYDWDKTTDTFSLKDQYDFLNPFQYYSNTNSFGYSGRCDNYSFRGYYQVTIYTRHDLSKVDEDGYLDVKNTATISVDPTNTMQPQQVLERSATLRWHAYELPVNTGGVNKQYFYNCDNNSTDSYYNYATYELTALELGADCRFRTTNTHDAGCYTLDDATVIMEDDQLELNLPSSLTGGEEQTISLGDGDYAFTSLGFSLSGTWYSKQDGTTKTWTSSPTEEMGEAPTVTLYLKQGGEWKEFRTGKLGSFTAGVSEADMPKNVTGYRYVIEHVKNTYVRLGSSYVYFTLYATSPKVQEVLKTYPSEDYPNPIVYFRNTDRTRVLDGETETYNRGKTVSLTLNRMQWSFYPGRGKEYTYVGSDKSLRQLNYQFKLYAYDYFNASIYGSSLLKKALQDGELPGYMDKLIFYDLLPEGMTYNEAASPTVQAYGLSTSSYPVSYTYETIDDYKESGRQLVIFYVEGSSQTALNYYNRYNGYSGFQVTFNAVVSWDNLRYLEDTGNINLAAAQLPDDNSWNWDSSYNTGTAFVHADTVSDGKNDPIMTNGKFASVLGSDGNPVFNDLNGNGDDDPSNTIYMYCTFDKPQVNISIQNGLTKWVKAANDSNGGGYGLSSSVEAGNTYEYLLNLQNDKDGYMEDVVLFDILEEADGLDDYGERTVEETHWKGTFKSINTMYPRLLGINVVVWYYTGDKSLTYEELRTSWNKGEGEGWVNKVPSDKSTIKALAVDMSKDRKGNAYRFEPEQATSITITMTAPSDWQDGKAYNRAALGCTTIPLTTDVGATSYKVGMRTDIGMYVKPVYEKSSDPESGANSSYPTTVEQGSVITYTIKVNPGVGSNGTTSYGSLPEDIVVSDQLPSGLQLVEGSITWNLQGGAMKDSTEKPTYVASSRTITWPTYQATEAKVSTFTFKAYVTPLEGSVSTRSYQNYATVKRGSTYNTTNYTYHNTQSRQISIQKAAAAVTDGGNLETYVTSSNVQTVNLGQLVQYKLTGTETSAELAGKTSGEIIITDNIPTNTTYVDGSIDGSITKYNSSSEAVVKKMEVLKDDDGNVTGLKWTLDKMAYKDTYTLTFRVKAPNNSDDPSTVDWEDTKSWSNQAQLVDVQKKETTNPETVTVIDSTGSLQKITKGESMYPESGYKQDSNILNHQVQDVRYGFYIQKNLTKASDTEQTFVFQIDYTPEDTTQSARTFYQTIEVPAGKTVVTRYISALPKGTYKVTELQTNWRYELQSSKNTTIKLINKNGATATFTNKLINEKWESDTEDVVNTMPKL